MSSAVVFYIEILSLKDFSGCINFKVGLEILFAPLSEVFIFENNKTLCRPNFFLLLVPISEKFIKKENKQILLFFVNLNYRGVYLTESRLFYAFSRVRDANKLVIQIPRCFPFALNLDL